MDKTLVGIIIGSCATLLGVALTSLFNYLIKTIELRDREKERKFKIEEKMIERSISSLIELFIRLGQMNILFLEFQISDKKHADIEEWRQEEQKKIAQALKETEKWFAVNGFHLPKEITDECKHLFDEVAHEFAEVIPYEMNEEVWKKLHQRIIQIKTAVEEIMKEYNPFYNMKIRSTE
jgi:hypothetical protein